MTGSVRQMADRIQQAMLQPGLPPVTVRELLVQATALYDSAMKESRETAHAYSRELLRCYESEPVANRAKIRAETSTQYLDRQAAAATEKFVVEAIRSLKALMRSQSEELRLT